MDEFTNPTNATQCNAMQRNATQLMDDGSWMMDERESIEPGKEVGG